MSPLRITLLWLAACLGLNGVIFALGWNDNADRIHPWFAPPGWVIGMVWTVLFVLMGTAHGRLYTRNDTRHRGIAALLLACLAYPLYTGGLQSSATGFTGNILTLGGTLALMLTARDSTTRWLLLPTALWLCFAAALTHATLSLNHLL